MAAPVLVVGGSGLLGPWLLDAAADLGPVYELSRHGEIAVDVTDGAAVGRAIARVRPALVIHAAALTDVDRCEADPATADAVNHLGVANVVAALPADAVLVLVSTDQVYPDSRGPHAEGETGPVNAYGRSKVAGEAAARQHPRTLVLRTTFFGPSRAQARSSLSDWFIERLRAEAVTPAFDDVRFSPLHAATVAGLILELVGRGDRGTFNVGSRDSLTKYEFGVAIARHLGLDASALAPTASTTVVGRAIRPLDLSLDVGRLEHALGRVLPSVHDEIALL